MPSKSSKKSLAVIVGASSKHDKFGKAESLPPTIRWGLAGALALEFAEKYTVVLMGRRMESLSAISKAIEARGGVAIPITCDVTSDESVRLAFETAKKSGNIDSLVFNAAPPYPPGIDFSNLPDPQDVDTDFLQQGFNIGVTGCLRCVKCVIGPMLDANAGSILLTGATQSLRGSASFACMSPIKSALRSLSQSMFQSYAPKGVHVVHIVIDGAIDSPGTREQFAGNTLQMLDPSDIAKAYLALTEQPKSCWSYELQLTPNTRPVGMRL